jgi:hypothetical protein
MKSVPVSRRSGLSRAISALLVLFVVFQPAAGFAVQILKASEKMSCCSRTKRNCCCRKDGNLSQSPKWKAVVASDCERSCSPASASVKPSLFVPTSVFTGRTTLSFVDAALRASAESAFSAYLAFLHQRPPPFVS